MLSRLLLAVLAALALVAPAVAQDETALIQKRQQVREMARDALASLYEIQPGARYVVDHAAGYAVQPGVYLYQLTDTGLAASLTLSGTRFFKDTDLH